MPRNGSGQYNLPYNWNDDKATGIKVLASRMQNQDQDIADALTASLTADGQTPYTGDQDFDGNKPINVADGSDLQDLTTIGQTQTGKLQYYGVSSTVPLGVAGVNYEVSATPTLPEYVDGLNFTFLAHATCLADPKLRAGTLAELTLVKTDGAGGTTALVAGDMILNNAYECYYHSIIGATKLLIKNPEKPYTNLLNATNATILIKGKSLLPSQITIANNSGTPNTNIDFSAGVFQFSDGSGQAVATAMTKMLQSSGSWAAGTGQNGLLSGVRANSSTYHCFAIYNPTTGAVDFGFLLGVAGTTPDPTSVLPSGYTKYKRVGSILTDGSGNIRAFTQTNGLFELIPPVLSISGASQSASTETTRTITTPLGIKTEANLNIRLLNNAATSAGTLKAYSYSVSLSSLGSEYGDTYASNNVVIGYAPSKATTNTSSQIKTNSQTLAGSPSMAIDIIVNGWTDLTL